MPAAGGHRRNRCVWCDAVIPRPRQPDNLPARRPPDRSDPPGHRADDSDSGPDRSPVAALRDRAPGRPAVEVRTSTRRRKYATAFWQGNRIVVLLPARMARSEHQAMVDQLVGRVLRHRPHAAASDAELAVRAATLGDRYLDGVRPASVRWSPHQRRRWGSCSLDTREIRISELLRPAPAWVVDAVLVHELAHLIERGHSRSFRELVARFERTAEADVFLAGYALGLEQNEAGTPVHDTDGPPLPACTAAADPITGRTPLSSVKPPVRGAPGQPPRSERSPRRDSAPGDGAMPLF